MLCVHENHFNALGHQLYHKILFLCLYLMSTTLYSMNCHSPATPLCLKPQEDASSKKGTERNVYKELVDMVSRFPHFFTYTLHLSPLFIQAQTLHYLYS